MVILGKRTGRIRQRTFMQVAVQLVVGAAAAVVAAVAAVMSQMLLLTMKEKRIGSVHQSPLPLSPLLSVARLTPR